jgi:hypothetical protein
MFRKREYKICNMNIVNWLDGGFLTSTSLLGFDDGHVIQIKRF